MRFVQKLRERGGHDDRSATGIPLPPAFRFTPEEWTSAYQTYGDGSPEDRNAFEAGLFLFGRMKRVRDELQTMDAHVPMMSAKDRAVGLCALLNVAVTRIGTQELPRPERAEVALEHALADRTIGDYPGDRYTSQEALDGMVDGAKLPLRLALAGKSIGVAKPREPVIQHEHALRNEMVLSRFYEGFESAWQGVRWTGARFHNRGSQYVFDETGSEHLVESRLDVFRRMRRFAHDSLDLASAVRRDMRPAALLPVPAAGSLKLCQFVDLNPEVKLHAIAVATQRAATTALEVQPFEHVIHPRFLVPIGKVLDVWSFLAFIAACCLSKARHFSEDAQAQSFPSVENAQTFSGAELVQVIAKCAELEPSCVVQILERFTFSRGSEGGRRDELWDRPLVPLGDDLILAWYPLLACEYTRLLARLASEAPKLQNAHADKGHDFEERVVEVLTLAMANAPAHVREHVQVLKARIDPQDPRVGDVDAILIVGDTAFVMECRTLKNAATSYEYWDVANDLLTDKGPQALRKRDYLRNHDGWLEEVAAKQ